MVFQHWAVESLSRWVVESLRVFERFLFWKQQDIYSSLSSTFMQVLFIKTEIRDFVRFFEILRDFTRFYEILWDFVRFWILFSEEINLCRQINRVKSQISNLIKFRRTQLTLKRQSNEDSLIFHWRLKQISSSMLCEYHPDWVEILLFLT
jgi:hypothetical protein